MSALGFLTAWANAPFAIAAGIAALFALLQVTGLLGVLAGGGDAEGDADVDHDVDMDHDVDADADVDHNVDADADHDVDHDADADHEHEGDHATAAARGAAAVVADRSIGASALAPLGFGKIPFSMIWQTYAAAFALSGFALNLPHFGDPAGIPLISLAWTVPVSFACGYVAVAVVARLLGPVLSSRGQEATSRGELVGQIGVVISSKVDEEFGEVRIRDKTGHDLRVICKLNKGAKKPPIENESVVVVDYERGELLVEPLEIDEDEGAVGQGRRAV